MNESGTALAWRSKVAAAAWIAVSAASLLCGYEFLRSVSQSLFISTYGSRNLPWVMSLAPLGTLLCIWGYGLLLSRVGARLTILGSCMISALAIAACYLAIGGGSRIATAALYVIRESYIVILVEQVWAFINSVLRREDGRALNGPVCGIASLGAIGGAVAVQHWVGAIGSVNLLLCAAVSLVPTALCALLAYGAGDEPQPEADAVHGRQGHIGVKSLVREKPLRWLALIIVLAQVISTVLDLLLSRHVELSIMTMDDRTRWYGAFYYQLNVWSAVSQFVVTPLLLRFVALRAIHVAVPAVHACLAALALLVPTRAAAAAAYTVFKVFDYSLFRGAKELIYIPLSYDARYRAKELIDAFAYRAAKGGMSAILAVAGRIAVLPLSLFASLALVASLAWVPAAIGLTRRERNTE